MTKRALVVTSIADDKHPILKKLTEDAGKSDLSFIVIGDSKSPSSFQLNGCDFWSIERQSSLPFSLAAITPQKHYSRKNLGYLIAIKGGVTELLETDDDNIPRAEFWAERSSQVECSSFENEGWINIYRFFTDKMIWPRGYPLEELQKPHPALTLKKPALSLCPIQQGLADENPDVDAVYRLTYPLPLSFEKKGKIALGKNSWSPFNSQNTYWFKEAFPLLYLPSYCSFRMTDIWRSYVAQRISWECGWSILYHEATVWQERNEHNLMKDFEDEIPGYTNNARICKELQKLELQPGKENIADNMRSCYSKLIEMGVVGPEEMKLLDAWISDLNILL
jgi:hypothetical protein